MKALISPEENNRIAEVAVQSFEVAQPLYWVDCADDVSSETHQVVDGVILLKPVHIPTYSELRASAYAPLAEQLDMQYWDAMNNTETWLDHINEVKAKYPKPTE